MVAGSSSTGSGVEGAAETRPKEILLFGVRVVVDNIRKIVSLNNMNDYEHLNDNEEDEEAAAGASASAAVSGYMSADDTVQHSSSASERRSQRKRGLPWTEEEHKRFLVGLQKMGKGDWRGISRNFVKTRTSTQVASHAQKHFLRNSNVNRRRRRSSLFDITTDMVTETPMEEQQALCQDSKSNNQAPKSNPPLQANSTTSFPGVLPFPIRRRTVNPAVSPLQIENPIMENRSLGQGNQSLNYSTNLVLTVPVVPAPCTSVMPDLDLNLKPVADSSPLSLDMSSSSDQRASSSRHSAFQTMSSLKNGDNIIVVA